MDRILRRDVIVTTCTLALVAAAVGIGIYLNSQDVPIRVNAPPLLGKWLPHADLATPLAIGLPILVIWLWPSVQARLDWRLLLPVAWVTSFGWVLACGLVRGWDWLATRLDGRGEYLWEVPDARWSDLFADFSGRILAFQPDNWTTHVAGHPPGALGFFMVLDRIGLSGSAWAGIVCMVLGTSSVVAIAITLRTLGSERIARAALPFLVLTPAALWIGASADAMFLAFASWGLTLLTVATRVRGPGRWAAALSGGVLLGCILYLSYGLVLFVFPVLAVLLITLDWRAVLIAGVGVLAVVAFWTIGGFVWWEAYPILVERYLQGAGGERPYSYFVWANLATLVLCVGPAIPAAFARLPEWFNWRNWTMLPIATGVAVLTATLSGMSKAEVERIWLPFALWLMPACAALPARHRRFWLVVQVLTALLIQHLIRTRW